MKLLVQDNNIALLRFDRGEEVIAGLTTYCQEQHITAASFYALGAAGEVVLSFYNLEEKRYEDHTLTEDLEIASMLGNVSKMDDNYVIHTHGVFGKQDLTTVGGHIKKLLVSATCEVTLTTFSGELKRAFDSETGLNLLT